VAIDQGGCFETSRPTTHSEPTFIVDGIVHYCVTNMPSSVARTATLALNQATLPYVLKLSSGGIQALLADEHLRNGLNVHRGKITLEVVARDQGLEYVPAFTALESS
jgi:alanine dehydrogenase